MAHVPGRLADLPQLASWYHQRAARPPDVAQVGECFAWNLCHALAATDDGATARAVNALRSFLETSPHHLVDFLAAVSHFADARADLLAELTLWAEGAVGSVHARPLGAVMSELADVTGLVALRFLAAWMALNQKELERCVDECEKVDQPYAHVYALQGQALLELGRAAEAALMLQGATDLAPSEVMAWFHLAKAQHVQGKTSAAWSALQACARLVPNNAEIALMMGLVALSDDARENMQLAASEALARLAELARSASFDVVYCRLRLATRLDRRDDALSIVAATHTSALLRDRRSLGKLAHLLREWHAKGWHEPSEKLLASALTGAEGACA